MPAFTSLLLAAALVGPGSDYQAVFLRAAPGHLVHLIDALKARMPVYQASGEPQPVLMRHAQGDQWDLVLLVPIGTLAEHFGAEKATRWAAAAKRVGFDELLFKQLMNDWVSWQEELYVEGPPSAELETTASNSGYFHLEIFQALAGKRDSLMTERLMEDDFSKRIGRPVNFIFKKITGPAWDAFTIGFYRDLQHYAEPAAVSAEEQEQAAKAAGFESRSDIGPYLRRFLNAHHDTLGSVVR